MELRTAQSGEMQQVKDLWEECFSDHDPYLSWFFGNVYRDEFTLVAAAGGEVLGALQLFPFTLQSRGELVDTYYIGGVSVWPKHRGKGIASAMMGKAHEMAAQANKKFTILMPAIEHFYEQLGYVSCYDYVECTFEAADLAKSSFGGSIQKATERNLPQLCLLYEQYMRSYEGYSVRFEQDFRRIMQEYNVQGGGIFMIYDHLGQIGGYAVILPENMLKVEECVHLNKEAAQGILQVATQWGLAKVVMRFAKRDMLRKQVYCGAFRMQIKPGMMVRPVGQMPMLQRATENHNVYINLLM